jgi:hypothetical protein
MLSRCANTVCATAFKHFGTGRIYLTEGRSMAGMPLCDLVQQSYWLCDRCAQQYTLVFKNSLPVLVRLPDAKSRPQAA